MQISNLPASGSFSGTDVLAIEVNGITYRLTGATLATALKTIGNYVSASDYPITVEHGGTGLTGNPSMLTNLGSTSADNVLKASPRPGVTGTLGPGNGGTGQTSLQATRNAMGLGNTTGALPVANGGTNATDAANARANLGLGNVDNTSDADKPVSTAQASALALKLNSADYKPFTGATGNTPGLAGIVPTPTSENQYLGSEGVWRSPDATPTEDSTALITSAAVFEALNNKQNALTFDTAPTNGSTNPVTSGGVYTAIQQSTAKNVVDITQNYTCQSESWEYTGVSIEIPAYACYGLIGINIFANALPVGAAFSFSSTDMSSHNAVGVAEEGNTCVCGYNGNAYSITLYLWGKWNSPSLNMASIKGWIC